MAELSVIIPFVNEWPQVVWTIRSIADELIDRVDFEIIAVSNYCDEVKEQGRDQDKGYAYLKNVVSGNPWLKVIEYNEKLSHWNAKRVGVDISTGDFLFFCDAHCAVGRDALVNMFFLYRDFFPVLKGTIHLPLTYQIMECHKLIYSLISDYEKGVLHYKFSSYREGEEPYEVPCMSTCGMIITRKLYHEVGGWPEPLGIYGGGENFINFTLAVLGYKKWIMPGKPLYHHGDKRGYNWNHFDYVYNRGVASYLYGGAKWLRRHIDNCKGRIEVLNMIYEDVLVKCSEQRKLIKEKQIFSVLEWIKMEEGK